MSNAPKYPGLLGAPSPHDAPPADIDAYELLVASLAANPPDELDLLPDDGNLDDVPLPTGPDQCKAWRGLSFRPRVRRGLALWAGRPEHTIIPSLTLGQLVRPGTPPWGTGQQILLVHATNMQAPFDPFGSLMSMPSTVLPASTTVLQWEQFVWIHQNPWTACYVYG